MAAVTTYTCDRCGHKTEDPSFLLRVAIVVSSPSFPSNDASNAAMKADWCRPCAINAGLRVADKPGEKQPKKLPTFEELVALIGKTLVEAGAVRQ